MRGQNQFYRIKRYHYNVYNIRIYIYIFQKLLDLETARHCTLHPALARAHLDENFGPRACIKYIYIYSTYTTVELLSKVAGASYVCSHNYPRQQQLGV